MPFVKHVDLRKLVAEHGKRCSRCRKKKAAKEFNSHKGRPDGKQVYCRVCQNSGRSKAQRLAYERSEKRKAYRRQWKASHPDAEKEYSRRYRLNAKTKKLQEVVERVRKSYETPRSLVGSSLGDV